MSKQKIKAISFMMASAFSFSVMQVFVKLTSKAVGTFEQVFFRNLISLLIAIVAIKKQKKDTFCEMRGQWALWGRSFFGFLGVVLFFYATNNAPQADVAMLNRSAPIFVTLFAGVFLKEKITTVKVSAVVLCLFGAYVAMQPSFSTNFLPLLAGLLAAVVSGIAYTLLAYTKGKVSPLTVILHFSIFSTIAAAVLMLPTFVFPPLKVLAELVVIGIFAAIGQIFLTYAYQLAPASEVSIYQYSGVVFTAILSMIVFGETLSRSSILGGSIILMAIFGVFKYY